MRRALASICCGFLLLTLCSCSGKKPEQSSATQTAPTVQNAPAPTTAPARKYDIKSGIVTFERAMNVGGTKLSNRVVVTFDDYGIKECRDEFVGDVLKQSYFTDGVKQYSTMYDKKTTYRRGESSRGTEYRVAWDEVSSTDKRLALVKQVSDIRVVGKTCEAYSVAREKEKTTFAGWGHVCLLMDTRSGSVHVIQKAVKFVENPVVDPAKFEPPTGFEVKDSPF